MAAELQHDRMGIEKTMVLSDYLADGLGQLGLNIISGLIGQLIYFAVDGKIENMYHAKDGAKYNNKTTKPVESMMFKNKF